MRLLTLAFAAFFILHFQSFATFTPCKWGLEGGIDDASIGQLVLEVQFITIIYIPASRLKHGQYSYVI